MKKPTYKIDTCELDIALETRPTEIFYLLSTMMGMGADDDAYYHDRLIRCIKVALSRPAIYEWFKRVQGFGTAWGPLFREAGYHVRKVRCVSGYYWKFTGRNP